MLTTATRVPGRLGGVVAGGGAAGGFVEAWRIGWPPPGGWAGDRFDQTPKPLTSAIAPATQAKVFFTRELLLWVRRPGSVTPRRTAGGRRRADDTILLPAIGSPLVPQRAAAVNAKR